MVVYRDILIPLYSTLGDENMLLGENNPCTEVLIFFIGEGGNPRGKNSSSEDVNSFPLKGPPNFPVMHIGL